MKMKKGLVLPVIGAVIMALGLVWWYTVGQPASHVVVVYVSEDQEFSEPILRAFEKETGITVNAVYDTEETSSTGAVNRLIAEKDNPQADVYWANEPIRAELLKQQGITAPYDSPNAKDIPAMFKDPEGHWTGFSARARIFIVNQNVKERPTTILAYTDPRYKGKGVFANPLFGTATAEVAALFTIWGDARTRAFLENLKKNEIKLSTSNSESADFVASGEFDFSLVDSDDAVNRIREEKPVMIVYPDQGKTDVGCMLIPNAAMLIAGAPHPNAGMALIDYLLSKETERKLALAACAQVPLHPGVIPPRELISVETMKVMNVNYAEVAKKMREIQPFLKDWAGL
jgi:iron(III) transport system substrate-binding protein